MGAEILGGKGIRERGPAWAVEAAQETGLLQCSACIWVTFYFPSSRNFPENDFCVSQL